MVMRCILQEFRARFRALKLAQKWREAFDISKFSPISCNFQVQCNKNFGQHTMKLQSVGLILKISRLTG